MSSLAIAAMSRAFLHHGRLQGVDGVGVHLVGQVAGGGGRDAALVEEVKALRQEVARMRAEASAERVAALDHASKTAALLKRWEGAGMPPVRV